MRLPRWTIALSYAEIWIRISLVLVKISIFQRRIHLMQSHITASDAIVMNIQINYLCVAKCSTFAVLPLFAIANMAAVFCTNTKPRQTLQAAEVQCHRFCPPTPFVCCTQPCSNCVLFTIHAPPVPEMVWSLSQAAIIEIDLHIYLSRRSVYSRWFCCHHLHEKRLHFRVVHVWKVTPQITFTPAVEGAFWNRREITNWCYLMLSVLFNVDVHIIVMNIINFTV